MRSSLAHALPRALRSGALRRPLAYLWQAPADLPPSLKLEWRFIAVRWLGIFFLTPGLLLANLPPDRLAAAYSILAVTAVYNLSISHVMRRRPELFLNGYIATLADTLLDIAMVKVGGGFDSPFYFILFTVTIGAAMRYGYGPSFATALIFISFDAFENVPTLKPVEASFVFRSGFLALTAIMASYLREQAHRAELALQERLRQANLLNEATALIAASLELEPTLSAVAAAASHLFDGSTAMLQPSTGLDHDSEALPTVTHAANGAPRRVLDELLALCSRGTETPLQADGDGRRVRPTRLASGQEAVLMVLALPTRQSSLAALAVARADGGRLPALDPDIVEGFVERSTLALENASLYRTLASRGDEIQRAYSDLATAHQELLSVDEMKTSFLANVSHELRTPLTSIRGFSELLLTYDDADVQQEFLHIINSESERLTRLVNDVLDITKIEAGYMEWHMQTFDLAGMLQDTARNYSILIEREKLVFRQQIEPGLPMVYGDPDRLQQVFSNLLTNALKFTPTGSITLAASRTDDQQIQVLISDTGIGIADEDQERIFDKFQQVGATLTNKPKGTGLGLSICRDIVAHHGGRIWVESELGVGSHFSITLPMADEAIPATSDVTDDGDVLAISHRGPRALVGAA